MVHWRRRGSGLPVRSLRQRRPSVGAGMSDESPPQEPGHAHEHGHQHEHQHQHGVTRRQVLQGGSAVLLGAAVLSRSGGAGVASVSAASLAGTDPFVAAMHVHACYSEGAGSWEAQYAAAVAAGANVLWQTDHDFRARALSYVTLLQGTFNGATTGSSAQHAATFSASGPIRLLIEASGTTAATQSLTMDPLKTATNFFRTGIDGVVPMGKASVRTSSSRTVAVAITNLPAGCTVQLLAGPVDFTGQDPGTSVVGSWSSTAFPGGKGTVTVAVDTGASCFIRPQVRLNGTLVATGTPPWLLRPPPPGGTRGSRR